MSNVGRERAYIVLRYGYTPFNQSAGENLDIHGKHLIAAPFHHCNEKNRERNSGRRGEGRLKGRIYIGMEENDLVRASFQISSLREKSEGG